MKSLNIFLVIAMAITSLTLNAQTTSVSKTETVNVSGNCGMCQSRIEKAAKDAGASTAKWNSETSLLSVSYNTSKTSLNNIEQKIAFVGHDTKSVKANDEAYNELHDCCKYERAVAVDVAPAT